MTTFNILQEIRALHALMLEHDEETGECLYTDEDLKDFVKEIKQNKATKLNNMQDLKLEMNASAEALKVKIDKLQARKKSIDNDILRVTELQKMLLDGDKLKTDEYNFYWTNTKSVDISNNVNIEDLDEDYIRVKKEFDKTAIKKALENGLLFDGISMLTNKNLVIK
ncbi:siphovirus Gp157 family protein [bacterium]|nr:siphovirus Gp157 family protein [bacterium]MBU1958628.1 siphovirus Gp157 family protein [bacterium]